MSESSMESVMSRLFDNPDWHQVIEWSGVWTHSRTEGFWREEGSWREMKQAEETAMTVEPVTILDVAFPSPPKKKVADLTATARLVKQYDELTNAINLAVAEQKEIRAQIEALMGDATEARVNGVPVFTFNPKSTYRTAEFTKMYPELVAHYTKPVTEDKVDWPSIIAHHKDGLLAPFQSREFRRAAGIQSA